MMNIAALFTVFLSLTPVQQADAISPSDIIACMESAYADFWPGFSVTDTPVMIFDGENTWLFNHAGKPDGFDVSGFDESVYVYAGRHPVVSANTSTDFNGTIVATYMYPDDTSRLSVEGSAAVCAHEIFHVFQHTAFPQIYANEASLFGYPYADHKVATLRFLEDGIIKKILQETDPGAKKALIAQYLAQRFRRFALMDEEYSLYERRIEVIEGTAQYIQNRYDKPEPVAYLAGIPKQMDKVRNRSYYTGYYLACWLDEYRPGWKAELVTQTNPYLDVLLVDSLLHSPAPAPAVDAELIKAAEAEATAQIAAYNSLLSRVKSEFLGKPGWKIEIVVDKGANLLALRGFDPVNVSNLGGGEVIHLRMLRLASSGNGQMEMVGSQCITYGPNVHPVFNGITKVTFSGIENLDGFTFEDGTSSFTSDELKFSFTNTRIEKDETGKTVTIYITPPLGE